MSLSANKPERAGLAHGEEFDYEVEVPGSPGTVHLVVKIVGFNGTGTRSEVGIPPGFVLDAMEAVVKHQRNLGQEDTVEPPVPSYRPAAERALARMKARGHVDPEARAARLAADLAKFGSDK